MDRYLRTQYSTATNDARDPAVQAADDMLEVISVVGLFTIATYSNNLMRTRIDPEYRMKPEPAGQG